MKHFYILVLFICFIGLAGESTAYTGNWRWRADDGSLSNATWLAAENTTTTLVGKNNIRLRVEYYGEILDAPGIAQLSYSASSGGPYINITNDGSTNAFKLSLTDHYANEDVTTEDLLTNSNSTTASNGLALESTFPGFTISPGQSREYEICIQTTDNAVDGQTYYFVFDGQPSPVPISLTYIDAPLISSTPDTTVAYDSAYSYSVSASIVEDLPTTLTAPTLPDWLTFTPGSSATALSIGNIPSNVSIVGVAGDGNGNIYAVNSNGSTIYKITSDGTTSVWASGLTSVFNVNDFHIEGGYIYMTKYTQGVYRISLDDPLSEELWDGSFASGSTVLALAGKADSLYVSATILTIIPPFTFSYSSEIYKIDTLTGTKDVYLTAADGLPDNANGMAFDSDGNLYITSGIEGKVFKYDGTSLTTVLSGLGTVNDIEQDAFGNFYVTIKNEGVRKYTSDFTSYTLMPEGTAINDWRLGLDNGNLVYLKYNTSEIYKYNLEASGILSGTPSKSDVGEHDVVIRATNDNGYSEQSFKIAVLDTISPICAALLPEDDSIEVPLMPTLSMTFDEDVILGSAGSLVLQSGGSTIRTYDLSVTADRNDFNMSADKKTISVDIDSPLPASSIIEVEISSAFVSDTLGNMFPGMTAASGDWNFTTTEIQDTIAPEVWCRNIGINLNPIDGETRMYAAFILDSVYDAGEIDSYGINVTSFDCGDIGKNLVELSVRDVSGNVGSCTAEVTVVDNNPPTVVCRDFEVTLNAAGIATISVDSIDDGSSDACGIAGMELSQSTFTGADLGENAVYLYVTDVNGNTDSCLAVVTVSDEIAPVANCNSIDVFVNDISGYALNSVDLAMLAAGSTDNATSFDSLTIEANPSVFTCEQIGDSVTVEITVIDEAGNESSCETTVFVNYQLALEVEDIEVSLDSGQCETAVSYPGVFTSESCAVLTQLEGLGAEGMFPAGTTVETWEVVLGESIDTVSFSVVVTPVEFAPTLNTVNDTTVSEDEVLVVELTGISDGGDCLPQELVISAESLNADLIESIAVTYEQGDSTAELSITFIAEQSGEAEVVVLVEDESGAIVTDTFAVIVESVNDAPTLVAAIADRDVQAEDVLSVSISRTLGDVFDDADGDELSWIFMSEEDTVYSWMSVNELASEYVLDFSPTQADTGCYTIIVQVSDTSGLTASDSFEVCVTAIPVGVANIDQSAFNVNIYPNPSKGLVSIEMETSSVEETEVSVSNVAGAEVLRRTFIAGDHIQLDLSENVSGMYLMRITQGGKHAIKKLILDKN